MQVCSGTRHRVPRSPLSDTPVAAVEPGNDALVKGYKMSLTHTIRRTACCSSVWLTARPSATWRPAALR